MEHKNQLFLAKQLELERPISEIIRLLWAGQYIPSSVVHNKVLYFCCHRYILPSTGVLLSKQIMETIKKAADLNDIINDIELILFTLVKRFNSKPKKYTKVTLRGFIINMIPYYIKELIDKYHRQVDNIDPTPQYMLNSIDTKDYSTLIKKDDYIEISKIGFIKYMKETFKMTSTELGQYYSINPASIRRVQAQ